ncbi:AbrB/MazE/SpoVT family DNA-binding domain-containing protein [Nostocoides veronense]|uniref:AbrB/MazE/SpoVT family DNA-binding domain-containing protein n=1 Tax=Nostocoides veronense TaxID=330836 RepID=UPI0031E3FC22
MTTATSKISRNGQFSLPAEVRRRWATERVVVVDQGDYVIVRPMTDDIVATLRGAYAGSGPNTDEARRHERAADATREARHE